ncbi:Hemolysin, contains CBS domains [Actinopolymorpha cephalotaxi]|uniref:CBS domain containing-hemolysin-like protein n=1 Tax=Actinopolymorpha cephalotaxi TaxID=504797 RepID=A0A1I2WWA0_9ACTN|nr:hemolysin family protein [Actinopolymorpha cephalotaxi]NYH85161.1 CBS domain containing-hemolysin-like protein [Actinopolymorpha cephalotaxi]SFH05565.1 Hemolysin, contains CBS domains [Actinopolymorpha cephalotaxi]
MTVALSILTGVVVVLVVTAATGYFVAQEFAYMAVDRNRLKARAAEGDAGARRALDITGRTSFMLSGAQLGITVTGLLAGYVAEPMIGSGLSQLLGGLRVPTGVGTATGALVALLFVTVVQMVFGELLAKNWAIARAEQLARALARSTSLYLKVFGPVVHVFDRAAVVLLRAVRITPVDDVEHAATARDLHRIVERSRDTGELAEDLSVLLDRSLDFTDATAGHAMVPRPRVVGIAADETVAGALAMMATGHSRLPVYGADVDDVVGVVQLRDLLTVDGDRHDSEAGRLPVRGFARSPVIVPTFLRLPQVLARLREAGEEFACVVDEYGGLAGVLTVEDIAEELVGEIADEHDRDDTGEHQVIAERTWLVPGTYGVDEVERLVGHDLPQGHYESIGGLLIQALGRLPEPGDEYALDLFGSSHVDEKGPAPGSLVLQVVDVDRRVPRSVKLTLRPADGAVAAAE